TPALAGPRGRAGQALRSAECRTLQAVRRSRACLARDRSRTHREQLCAAGRGQRRGALAVRLSGLHWFEERDKTERRVFYLSLPALRRRLRLVERCLLR